MASGPRKTKTKHYEVPETNLYIVCYVGDIRDASTKGVVTGENSQHSNKASQVTAALSEVLGKTYINNRLKHLAHKKHEQDVFVVETGRRDSLEYVFHVCVTGFPVFAIPENWVLEMQSVYKSVWEMADRKGVESLTLPLLGAGNAEAPLKMAVKALVHSLFQCKTRKLKEIRIVSMHEDVHKEVLELCDEYLKKCYSNSSGRPKRSSGSFDVPKSDKHYQTTYQQDYGQITHDRKTENLQFQREYGHSSKIRHNGVISGKDVTAGTGSNTTIGQRSSKCQKTHGGRISIHNSELAVAMDTDKSRSLCRGDYVAINRSSTDEKRDSKTQDSASTSEQCPICMDVMKQPEQLSKCGHRFCHHCIDDCFKYKPVCPICNTIYGVVTGNQPDGMMLVERSRKHLPGHPECGTIIIAYIFDDGIQKSDHPNPGKKYHGTNRTAYLPDNDDGRKVCRLLKTAFDRKLTFTIGQSSTTGIDDVVTWNDIHHKTSIHGGQQRFGYPDPTYISRVQDELASKGVTEETDVEY